MAAGLDQFGQGAQRSARRLRLAARRGAEQARHRRSSMYRLLSPRPYRIEMLLVLGFLAVTRIFSLRAAKIGIQIGALPLFLTDLTLLALLVAALFLRPGRLLVWLSSGRGATAAGAALWMLCGASLIYFAQAFPAYRIMAARDLATFSYALFFPLTFFALTDRLWAVRVTRYCVYSGVVLAVMMLAQRVTGLDLWLGELQRNIGGSWISYVGSDDHGAIAASSMMGLFAYLMLEREHRRFHAAAALVCFLALAANGARSAVVGVVLCAIVMFFAVSTRHRVFFAVLCASLLALAVLATVLPQSIPGVPELHNFVLGVTSAGSGNSDLDTSFRLVRWRDAFDTWLGSPAFGVGYGCDILNRVYIGYNLAGKFNEGMPHNTYLFVLARMGLFGLGLIGFAMMLGMRRLFAAVRRYRLPDDLAALNVLVTLAAYGAFVLFFERPMNNAGFWIMLAAGLRLAGSARDAKRAELASRLETATAPRRARIEIRRLAVID